MENNDYGTIQGNSGAEDSIRINLKDSHVIPKYIMEDPKLGYEFKENLTRFGFNPNKKLMAGHQGGETVDVMSDEFVANKDVVDRFKLAGIDINKYSPYAEKKGDDMSLFDMGRIPKASNGISMGPGEWITKDPYGAAGPDIGYKKDGSDFYKDRELTPRPPLQRGPNPPARKSPPPDTTEDKTKTPPPPGDGLDKYMRNVGYATDALYAGTAITRAVQMHKNNQLRYHDMPRPRLNEYNPLKQNTWEFEQRAKEDIARGNRSALRYAREANMQEAIPGIAVNYADQVEKINLGILESQQKMDQYNHANEQRNQEMNNASLNRYDEMNRAGKDQFNKDVQQGNNELTDALLATGNSWLNTKIQAGALKQQDKLYSRNDKLLEAAMSDDPVKRAMAIKILNSYGMNSPVGHIQNSGLYDNKVKQDDNG